MPLKNLHNLFMLVKCKQATSKNLIPIFFLKELQDKIQINYFSISAVLNQRISITNYVS